MSLGSEFTQDDIREAIKKGFNRATEFIGSQPTGESVLNRIEKLRSATIKVLDNFQPDLYNERRNADKPEHLMREMLSCAFRACEELRIIEEKTFVGRANKDMIRAYYLDFEILLPKAVTVFRTKGKNSSPDASVLNDVRIIDNALHAA